jgi:hypothetical protein
MEERLNGGANPCLSITFLCLFMSLVVMAALPMPASAGNQSGASLCVELGIGASVEYEEQTTITVGPFKNEKGEPLKDVLVTLSNGTVSLSSRTDSDGMVRMTVPVTWEEEDISAEGVNKEGSRLAFNGTIGPDGEFKPTDGTCLTFSHEKGPEKDHGLVWRVAFLSLTILVFSVLIVKIRQR